MRKIILFIIVFILLICAVVSIQKYKNNTVQYIPQANPTTQVIPTNTVMPVQDPLAITGMQQKKYSGSEIVVESQLGSNAYYTSYVVSYASDGLKQYALLTVPVGTKPKDGWPVILFNHGYIPPAQYDTQSSYASMVTPLARAGYIVIKPDYRGNGNSEGTPQQIYISPGYVTDSMNALAAIKKYKDANPQKIGVFGHSMGGNITLHELVISQDIKAAEIMAGTVGDETSILQWWDKRIADKSITGNDLATSVVVEQMIANHKSPDANPTYWDAIDATKFTSSIVSPVQIQVGAADADVPVTFSTQLRDNLNKLGKSVDFHIYPGADHNLSPETAVAMNVAISFFDKYLK